MVLMETVAGNGKQERTYGSTGLRGTEQPNLTRETYFSDANRKRKNYVPFSADHKKPKATTLIVNASSAGSDDHVAYDAGHHLSPRCSPCGVKAIGRQAFSASG